jgi:hypothetical protein
LEQLVRQDDMPAWKLWYDPEVSDLTHNFAGPFSDALLSEGMRFMNKVGSGSLRLCIDATHEFGRQKWKLIKAKFLGAHFGVGDRWHVTLIPFGFCLSLEENIPASEALPRGIVKHMQDRHSVGLTNKVTHVHLDGGPALSSASSTVFPDAAQIRCLQHVKKNVGEYRGWTKERKAGMPKTLRRWVMESASLQPVLLDIFWQDVLAHLTAAGETKVVGYLRSHHLTVGETITAPWACGGGVLESPFTSYASNCIEALWKALD